jgi:ribonuclease D
LLITTIDSLAAFAERARGGDVLAIDTEFLREKTYYPRLCLLQLGTDDEQVAVDPFKVGGTDVLRDLFSDPSLTKVLHACSQDLEIILEHYGVIPHPLFDTQVAAAFLGDRAQLGYGALVEEYCGVNLPKTESMTDWSRRPLDERQLAYAYDDVKYLPGIWRTMTRDLEREGRLGWVESEVDRLADPRNYRHDPGEAWKRLRHSGGLTRRQLGVARELCAWREERAQRLDRPRRWVMSDEVLTEVARRCPSSEDSLRRIRGTDALSRSDAGAVLAAVACGLRADVEQLPDAGSRRPRPTNDQESVCDLMYALARKVADAEGIAVTLLASRDDLMGYLFDPASSPLSHGWRHEVIGSLLDDLLGGRLGLTVRDGKVDTV